MIKELVGIASRGCLLISLQNSVKYTVVSKKKEKSFMIKPTEKTRYLYVYILAVIFAGILTLYRRYAKLRYGGNLIFFLCLAAVFAGVLYLAFRFLDYLRNMDRAPFSKPGMLWFFLLLLAMWTPWFVLCFPGNVAYDSGTSILFGLGIDCGNVNNPPFQNLLFSTVYRLGAVVNCVDGAVFLYNILQSVAYALCIACALEQLRRWCVPKPIVIVLLLFYGLCPFVPVYAFTMAKDSNFSVAVFAFSFLLLKLIIEKDDFVRNKLKMTLLTLSGCALALFRNHGFAIAALGLLAALVLLAREHKRGLRWLAAVLCTITVINFAVPMFLRAPKSDLSESLSIPIQQTAYYFIHYPDEISEEEYRAVDAVVSTELFKNYNPMLSDPIKDQFRDDATKEELLAYFRVWWQQFLRHPGAYFKALYDQNYIYYTPDTMTSLKPHRIWGYWLDARVYEQTEFEDPQWPLLQYAKAVDTKLTDLPVIGIFQKIGIYTWILLATTAYLLYSRKSRILLALIPVTVVLIGCCFSPVNGYFRYALPMILTIPSLGVGVIWASKGAIRAAVSESGSDRRAV